MLHAASRAAAECCTARHVVRAAQHTALQPPTRSQNIVAAYRALRQQRRGLAAPGGTRAAAAAGGPLPDEHPQHQLPEAPVEPSVLASRQWMQRVLPLQQFKAVGVSFDDRQLLVPALTKEQGVAFVREPDNPHDPHAVSIRTLDGRSLGYIPRDQTFHFTQELCFGAVGSVGQQGADGLWGFNVLVQPSLPPVEVLALPASLAPRLALGLQLRGAAWERLKAAAVTAGGGRCSVTGAPLAAPAERWVFDDERRVLRLTGYRLVAPEVAQVGGLLALKGRRAVEGATELLQVANAWSSADVVAYLAGVRAEAARRGAAEWRLDLSWLRARGVDPPPELVPELA